MAGKNSLNEILNTMEEMINDPMIPRNIKRAVTEAKTRLKGEGDLKVKVSGAIYVIQSVSDDINIPAHARTQLWALLSELESMA